VLRKKEISSHLVDSYFRQKPPAPLKVGTPDSALTPAPVAQVNFFGTRQMKKITPLPLSAQWSYSVVLKF